MPKIQKLYLMPLCLTLSIIRYGSRVKWSNPGNGIVHSPTPRCSKLLKRREEAHERKKNRYATLHADCVEKGWICHVIPIEVGCRGFIGHSVISFLSKIGITGSSLTVATNRLQTAAQYASSWIWSKARSFQHEVNTRGTTFPV